MNLRTIEKQRGAFLNFLKTEEAQEYTYWYESQAAFQAAWDLSEPDLASMYDRSLQNNQTRRLWKREQHSPKQVLLSLLHEFPELGRDMFKDLFREENHIEGRVSRFIFHCDELLAAWKKAHPESVENNHYHDDEYQMVFLYLSFRFPDQYAFYFFPAFREFLQTTQAKEPPLSHDVERFVKTSRVLYKLITKEEGLIEAHQARLNPEVHYMEPSLLLVSEFLLFTRKLQIPVF